MAEVIHTDTLRAELLEKRAERALKALDDLQHYLRGKTPLSLTTLELSSAWLASEEIREHLTGRNDNAGLPREPLSPALQELASLCPDCHYIKDAGRICPTCQERGIDV